MRRLSITVLFNPNVFFGILFNANTDFLCVQETACRRRNFGVSLLRQTSGKDNKSSNNKSGVDNKSDNGKRQINARKPRYKSINYYFCAFISEEVAGFKRQNATKEVKKEERLSSSFFCSYRFNFPHGFTVKSANFMR